MSVPLFKDFRNETSSLLTGMYSGSGKWKVEGKGGNSKEDFVTLSPSVSNDGLVINAEVKPKQAPITLKASTSLEKKVKKVSANWKYDNHRFDLSFDPSRTFSFSRFSLSHSYTDKLFSFSDSINRKYADFSIAMKATDYLALGMGARLDLRKWIKESDEPSSAEKTSSKHAKKVKIGSEAPRDATPIVTSAPNPIATNGKVLGTNASKLPYSPLDSLDYISFDFGGRLRRGQRVADILVSDNFSLFSVGLMTSFSSERKISFATELKYRVRDHLMNRKGASEAAALSNIVTLSAGISMACPLFSQNTVKARMSEDRRISLCYIWQQKGLTTSITLNDKGKFGAQFVGSGDSFSSSPVTKHKSSKESKESSKSKPLKVNPSPAKTVTL